MAAKQNEEITEVIIKMHNEKSHRRMSIKTIKDETEEFYINKPIYTLSGILFNLVLQCVRKKNT